MKFAESARKVVYPAIIERAERDIEAVNKWQDDLEGVSVGMRWMWVLPKGAVLPFNLQGSCPERLES